ncbi:MAG: hypothetical protein JWQ96_255 [Segetibacter sp.]|nr:hypothetical protein [Segetibacter sp.]
MNLLSLSIILLVVLVVGLIIFKKGRKKKLVKAGETVLLNPKYFKMYPKDLRQSIFTVEAISNNMAQVIYMHQNGKQILKTDLPVSQLLVAS